MDEKESILRVKRGARSKADLRGRGQVLKRSATIYRHIDVIKFLCKDLWTLVFRKQIDNLKTNHRV